MLSSDKTQTYSASPLTIPTTSPLNPPFHTSNKSPSTRSPDSPKQQPHPPTKPRLKPQPPHQPSRQRPSQLAEVDTDEASAAQEYKSRHLRVPRETNADFRNYATAADTVSGSWIETSCGANSVAVLTSRLLTTVIVVALAPPYPSASAAALYALLVPAPALITVKTEI